MHLPKPLSLAIFFVIAVLLTIKHIWQGKRFGYDRGRQPTRFWLHILTDLVVLAVVAAYFLKRVWIGK
jgi:hypothetical protein